jgi:hypothetical protein
LKIRQVLIATIIATIATMTVSRAVFSASNYLYKGSEEVQREDQQGLKKYIRDMKIRYLGNKYLVDTGAGDVFHDSPDSAKSFRLKEPEELVLIDWILPNSFTSSSLPSGWWKVRLASGKIAYVEHDVPIHGGWNWLSAVSFEEAQELAEQSEKDRLALILNKERRGKKEKGGANTAAVGSVKLKQATILGEIVKVGQGADIVQGRIRADKFVASGYSYGDPSKGYYKDGDVTYIITYGPPSGGAGGYVVKQIEKLGK